MREVATKLQTRFVALATVGLAVLFTAVAALASSSPTIWRELAARVSFPVYQPTVTLGFKAMLQGPIPCGFGGIETIGARYDKGGGKQAPVIGFGEAYPQICGNAGESTTVTSVDIHGVKVLLSVFCRSPGPKCTVKDGFTHGFLLYLHQPGPKRTWIEISSPHVSLDDLLKVGRSLTRVVPARPTGSTGAPGCSKATDVARQANALLASALEASLTADQHYLDWVGARIAGNTGAAKTALAAAQAQDVRATSFKRRFLSVYNRLRTAAGLAPLPPDFAF